MTVAFELAGMVVAITLAAAFICWDADRLHDRAVRNWYRRLREPGVEEATANFVWRTRRDEEFLAAMWITTLRDIDRFNDLLLEALKVGSPSVGDGTDGNQSSCVHDASASPAPTPWLRALPTLSASEVTA